MTVVCFVCLFVFVVVVCLFCFVLLEFEILRGAAMLVRSSQIKSSERLARDVFDLFQFSRFELPLFVTSLSRCRT